MIRLQTYTGIAFCLGLMPMPALAQVTHEHTGAHTHEEHIHLLHFTHPLIAESVSPDTKARLNYAHMRHTDETDLEFEGEYAFAPNFSIEVGLEYNQEEATFEHLHVAPKLASFRWRERMLLVGYGFTVGTPVDGRSAFDLEPFVNAGVKRGDWELEAWMKYTHSFATDDAEASNALGYNAVALLHAVSLIQPVLELDGAASLGDANVDDETRLTPSLRIVPIKGSGLALAGGISIPVSGDDGKSTIALSAFYHF